MRDTIDLERHREKLKVLGGIAKSWFGPGHTYFALKPCPLGINDTSGKSVFCSNEETNRKSIRLHFVA